MHELSIAQALIGHLEDAAAREGGGRVCRVDLVVGALSGVDPEALDLAFPIAAEGTVAEGAVLTIERTDAKMRCRACEYEWAPDFPVPFCEECESMDVDCIGGRELMIRCAELETH
jgi:hydrogenase nickel incorporation protein HypA/HybF